MNMKLFPAEPWIQRCKSPVGNPQLIQFSREIIDLLKSQPSCIMPMSKFIPSYHHHFAKQCRVSDYGYTKLLELLEAVPHVLQVLRIIMFTLSLLLSAYHVLGFFYLYCIVHWFSFSCRFWAWVPSVYWHLPIVLKWSALLKTCWSCWNFKPANKLQSRTSCRRTIGQLILLRPIYNIYTLHLSFVEVLIVFPYKFVLLFSPWTVVGNMVWMENNWSFLMNLFIFVSGASPETGK